MERREFVAICATAAAALLAGCVSMVTHPVPMSGGRVRLSVAAFPDLAQPNGAIKVQPAGFPEPIYVLTGASGYAALSPVCTHKGCTVDVNGARLVCPCHGSTYNDAGVRVYGPAPRSMDTMKITIEYCTI